MARRLSHDPALSAGRSATRGWDVIRGMLRKDFVARIQSFDSRQLSSAACARVRAALPMGNDALARVTKGSKAAGPLYSWVVAQLAHGEALLTAAPLLAELEGMDRDMVRLQEAKNASSAQVFAMQQRVEWCFP